MSALPALLACAVCYGDPSSAQTHGANLAIFTMLGVTGLVLTGCASFMVTLARRARRHAALECSRERQATPTLGVGVALVAKPLLKETKL